MGEERGCGKRRQKWGKGGSNPRSKGADSEGYGAGISAGEERSCGKGSGNGANGRKQPEEYEAGLEG